MSHKTTNWSPEQKQVIDSNQDRFSVRASAGSGKTSVLVDRYLRHVIQDNFSPEEIITVTFTHRAANEMKSRIIRRLRSIGRLDDAQRAETGPIQTIHGFCERILRENSIEANIDPDFEIITGSQFDVIEIEAVTRAMLQARTESKFAAELIYSLSNQRDYLNQQLHSKLRNLVMTLTRQFRSAGMDADQLRSDYGSLDAVLDLWKRELLRRLPEEISGAASSELGDNWVQVVLQKCQETGHPIPSWLNVYNLENELQSARDSCGMVWLVLETWQHIEQTMISKQQFDFTMLERKAIDLLQDSELTRERLKKQCKALMVDEAQDLNPLQYKLLAGIHPKFEMLVGDPQQSIYGFRFADSRLFVERCNQTDTYYLSKNFRSDDGILAFNDEVFSKFWAADYSPFLPPSDCEAENDPFGSLDKRSFDGVEVWPLPSRNFNSVADMTVELLNEGWKPDQIAVLVMKNASATAVKESLEKRSVAVRTVGTASTFFTRMEVRDLANVLESLADPYQDFQLLAILRGPFVELSLDCVTYLAAQKEVFESLQRPGPWNADDQEKIETFMEWFHSLRETIDRIPAWETITSLLSLTPFLRNTLSYGNSEQVLANIRKLHCLAMDEPTLNARDYSQKIRDIQFLTHREGDAPIIDGSANAITVSTVHKAKGLEFDVVILADTHDMKTKQPNQILSDPKTGVAVYAAGGDSAIFRAMKDETKANAMAELERTLYVAMTRAKRKLCIVINETKGSKNMAEHLSGFSRTAQGFKPGILVRSVKPPPEVD